MEDSDILDIICEFCDDDLVQGSDDIGIGACGSEDWFDKIKSEHPRDSIVTNSTQIKNEISNSNILRKSDNILTKDLYSPAVFQWDNIHDDLDDDLDDDDDEADCGKDRKRKRARQPNPDAELIADATEKNLKMLNLDPNSKEGKRQRRKIRNRMSAQIHRERKKAYIETLEGMVRERDEKIVQLQNDMRLIVLENEKLRGQLNMLAPANEIFNDQMPHLSPMSDGFNTSTTVSTNSGIISDSEESFNSARSSSHSPATNRGYTSLNTGLSLFSVMMMLGITLFSGPLPLPESLSPYSNSMSGDNTFSSQSLNTLSVLQLGTSSYFPTSESKINAPLGSGTMGGGGRVLLSTPETDEDERVMIPNYYDTYSSSVYFSSVPLLPPVTSTQSHDKHHPIQSSALWKYQDHVAQLFPLINRRNHTHTNTNIESDHHQSSSSSSSTTSTIQNKRRVRHLRSGSVDSSSSSRSSSTPEATALVVARSTLGMKSNPSTTTSTSSTSSQYSDSSSFEGGSFGSSSSGSSGSVSHVLMTSGRALLDHSLFTFPDLSESKHHQIISTSSSSSSSSSNPLTPISIPLMSTTTTTLPQKFPSETIDKALSPWNLKYNDVNPPLPPHPHNNNNNDHTSGESSTTIRPLIKIDSSLSPTSPPVLVMLLPASSIRWGSTWQNSSSDHPFHSYTNTKQDNSNSNSYSSSSSSRMNHNNNNHHHEDEAREGGDDKNNGYDRSSLWVEIKCSVYSAELVRNVTLY